MWRKRLQMGGGVRSVVSQDLGYHKFLKDYKISIEFKKI